MYNIKLFKGYEGKDFIGMSPEEVVKNLPNFEETYFLGENDEIRRDMSRDFIAYYDEDNKSCIAIQFVNTEIDVCLNDMQLMGIPEKILISELKKLFPSEEIITDGENYVLVEKSLSIFVTEAAVGGVLVGQKDYFDFIKEELVEPGPSRLQPISSSSQKNKLK